MNYRLPHDKLTIAEKLQNMDIIWDNLCNKANTITPSACNQKLLNEKDSDSKIILTEK